MTTHDKSIADLLSTSMPPAQEVTVRDDGTRVVKTKPFIIVGENGVQAFDYAVFEMAPDRAMQLTEQPVEEGINVRVTMPAPRLIALKPAGAPEISIHPQ